MTNWGSAETVGDLSEDDGVRKTRATIRYLADSDFVTRRFVSAGVEHSTVRSVEINPATPDTLFLRPVGHIQPHGTAPETGGRGMDHQYCLPR
jgi:hypothetical protein